MQSNTLFLLFIISIAYIQSSLGFAQWMLNEYCTRSLVEGEIIMNSPVVRSPDRFVVVQRGPQLLKSKVDTYVPGERLSLVISDTGGQYLFEVSDNAFFPDGGCEGKRAVGSQVLLELPPPGTREAAQPVEIITAWANGHEQVKVSEKFILLPSPIAIKMLNQTRDNPRPFIKHLTKGAIRPKPERTESKQDDDDESSKKKPKQLSPRLANVEDRHSREFNAKRDRSNENRVQIKTDKHDDDDDDDDNVEAQRDRRIQKEKSFSYRFGLRGGVRIGGSEYSVVFVLLAATALVFILYKVYTNRFKITRSILRMRGFQVDR